MTAKELKLYEVKEYKKAFMAGTDKAWKQYRANVKRMITKFENNTGIKVNADALMS